MGEGPGGLGGSRAPRYRPTRAAIPARCARLRIQRYSAIQRCSAQRGDSGGRVELLHHIVRPPPACRTSHLYRVGDPDRGNGAGERRRIDHRSDGCEDTCQPMVISKMTVTTYCRRRSSAGFTMVELLVTIAIAAILATVAVPSFSGLIASQRAKTAASELFASFLTARSD